MKPTVLSAIIIFTSRDAGAFVGQYGFVKLHAHPGDCRMGDPCRRHVCSSSRASHGPALVPKMTISRIVRCLQLARLPRVTQLPAAGGDGGAGAGGKEGEPEAEGKGAAAGSEDSSAETSGQAPESAQQGQGGDATQEGAGVTGDTVNDEVEGETVYLPAGDNRDFRLFRAKLRAGSDEKWRDQLKRNVNTEQLGGQDAWAHELSAPEKGCLIVAKSNQFSMAQTYFNQAVIFLASHDEMGSAGFILNRPTTVRLGDLVEGNALPQFRNTPLYLGGDVGEGNVQILHPFGPDKLAGSMEIIPGVYIGGAVNEANDMVATGSARVDDFKFMLHLCGWAPGQLQAEIDRGIVMKHCLGLPVPLWREVMTLMGPKYGLLARDTYDDL